VERALTLILLVAVAAMLAAGCGGAERLEYERDLAEVGRIVDDSLEQLPEDDGSSVGPSEVARIADDLREAADQLADLDPPADAAKAQARLERGLRGVAESFDDLAAELRSANSDDRKADLFVSFATDEDVEAAFADLLEAQEAFAREGYRVFGDRPVAAKPAAK
jgi:hypothetical protein